MGAKLSIEDEREGPAAGPRLVYTQAPVLLAKLLEPAEEGRWRVDLGAVQRDLVVDGSVDPALLVEAHASGARALVDAAGEPTIVGVVATRRALTLDEEGRVEHSVRSLKVTAEDELLLRVPGAFVRAKAREIEVYGDRVLTRARTLAKVLAAMIKLN